MAIGCRGVAAAHDGALLHPPAHTAYSGTVSFRPRTSAPSRPAHSGAGGRRRRALPFLVSSFPTAALLLGLTACGPSAGHEVVGASTPSSTIDAGQATIFQLSPGQCFDRPAAGDDLFRVNVVPCEVAHDQEMYAVLQLDHPSFPGEGAVQDEATARCAGEFLAFTGTTAEESRLTFSSFVPSEGSWAEGDRQVLCALELDSGGRMIGSQHRLG